MCVSSQAGCGMNCPFCATGQAGLTRNMSAAEIVDQVVAGARMLDRGEVGAGRARISNVVFMGMGEPLANYKAVIAAVRRLSDPVPDGLGISQRSITVSTVGLVPAIDRTSCATPWCPSTPAGRWARCSTPRGATPAGRGAGSRSSTR
jgi:23S rRNA (adenine2503-C2)-methyltransferase